MLSSCVGASPAADRSGSTETIPAARAMPTARLGNKAPPRRGPTLARRITRPRASSIPRSLLSISLLELRERIQLLEPLLSDTPALVGRLASSVGRVALSLEHGA